MDFEKIIEYGFQNNASDVHFTPGSPVFLRIFGKIQSQGNPLTVDDIQNLAKTLLPEPKLKELQETRQTDFLAHTKSGKRLRGNAFFERNGLAISFRLILPEIPTYEFTGLPEFVKEQVMGLKHGLVLVVGPTGQGKSTSLAVLLQERMNQKSEHLITVEDPVEYLFKSGKGIVQQRQVGRDVKNFKSGITGALREDPDVLMVGEMRDFETISAAITMAETGHLVFGTLHTNDVTQTISRIIDSFPAAEQEQVMVQLASVLSMVISQRLVLNKEENGLVLASEVLTMNYAIQNFIRQNKVFQIPNAMQTDTSGKTQVFEQSLAQLIIDDKITKERAFEYAHDPNYLENVLDKLRQQPAAAPAAPATTPAAAAPAPTSSAAPAAPAAPAPASAPVSGVTINPS